MFFLENEIGRVFVGLNDIVGLMRPLYLVQYLSWCYEERYCYLAVVIAWSHGEFHRLYRAEEIVAEQ